MALKDLFKEQAKEIQEQIDEDNQGLLLQELERRRQYLPDFNPSAKTASKVYNVRSVVSDSHMEVLRNNNSVQAVKKWHPFVEDIWARNLEKQPEDLKADYQLKLVYLNYLFELSRTKQIKGNLEEVALAKGIPYSVFGDMVQKFYHEVISKEEYSGVKYTRSNELALKLESHIIVLALLLQE